MPRLLPVRHHARAGQRQNPYLGRARHRRQHRVHSKRPLRERGRPPRPKRDPRSASSICAAAPWCPDWSNRIFTSSAWPIVPAITRFSKIRLHSRSPGSAGRTAQRCASGRVDHFDGRLASEPVGRTSSSHAGRTWTRRFPIGPCSCTNASPVPPPPTVWARRFSMPPMPRRPCIPISRRSTFRQWRDRRGRIRRRRSVGFGAVSAAPDADLRRQETQHARCDALRGQRRADLASGSGVVPHARVRFIRTRSSRTSISTACTIRGSTCIAKAAPSSGCR